MSFKGYKEFSYSQKCGQVYRKNASDTIKAKGIFRKLQTVWIPECQMGGGGRG